MEREKKERMKIKERKKTGTTCSRKRELSTSELSFVHFRFWGKVNFLTKDQLNWIRILRTHHESPQSQQSKRDFSTSEWFYVFFLHLTIQSLPVFEHPYIIQSFTSLPQLVSGSAMEEIKSDSTPQHRLIPVEPQVVLSEPPKSKRVASLDIFRGLTVAVLLSLSALLSRRVTVGSSITWIGYWMISKWMIQSAFSSGFMCFVIEEKSLSEKSPSGHNSFGERDNISSKTHFNVFEQFWCSGFNCSFLIFSLSC